jgi:type I restriction enzyme S subunit
VVQSTAYREFVIAHAGGAAQPNANAKTLGAFPVPIPTLPTQRRIAAVLSTFDELIEINQRRIELLEDLARSLYREWFVRFRFPGHEDATFVDSTRGEIPERWTVRRLDAIAAIIMGQSPKSEFYNEIGEGLPFHQGVADYGDLLPTHRKFCTLESRTADAMDVLCSVRAPVGRLNLADERLVIGRGLSGIRRVDHNQALLLEQLRSPLGEEDSLGSGTIFKAINKEQLGGLPIVEPAADIGSAFELTARPMLDERVQRTLQNRQLAGTRDLLLPRLVTGRLDIAEIDLGELLPPEAA